MDTAVVLNAHTAIGKAVTDALIEKNINTKILVPDLHRYQNLYPNRELPGEVNVIVGDLDDNHALASVCEYSDTIFPCFDPQPTRLVENSPKWVAKISDIGATLGAHILFPSDLVVYGKGLSSPINEEAPQKSSATIGQMFISIENRLKKSAMEGANLTIVRFPWIFGPVGKNYYISQNFIRAIDGKNAIWPTNTDIPHDFVYSNDAGEALVRAAMKPQASNASFNYSGNNRMTPKDFIRTVYRLERQDEPKISIESKIKRGLYSFMSRNWELSNELLYLHREKFLLDGETFDKIFGTTTTDFDEAIKQTLNWYKSVNKEN